MGDKGRLGCLVSAQGPHVPRPQPGNVLAVCANLAHPTVRHPPIEQKPATVVHVSICAADYGLITLKLSQQSPVIILES